MLQELHHIKKYSKTYRVGILQARAYRILLQTTGKKLKRFSITPLDWAIIGTLADKTRVSLKELATTLGIKAPLITRRAKSLHNKNFIILTHPKDLRFKIASLSQNGKNQVKIIESNLRKDLKFLLNGVTIKDMYGYLKVLESIIKNQNLT